MTAPAWKVGQRVKWDADGAPDRGLLGTVTAVEGNRIRVLWDDGEGHGWYRPPVASVIAVADPKRRKAVSK